MQTRTLDTWTFIGEDGSKGFRKGKAYKLDVTINQDPSDFFIHINPHTDFLSLRSWKLDDTFYATHEMFDSNWHLEASNIKGIKE